MTINRCSLMIKSALSQYKNELDAMKSNKESALLREMHDSFDHQCKIEGHVGSGLFISTDFVNILWQMAGAHQKPGIYQKPGILFNSTCSTLSSTLTIQHRVGAIRQAVLTYRDTVPQKGEVRRLILWISHQVNVIIDQQTVWILFALPFK
jgi:hypothetical protein